jgi:peptidoglycan DL-endopeptidase CwlO
MARRVRRPVRLLAVAVAAATIAGGVLSADVAGAGPSTAPAAAPGPSQVQSVKAQVAAAERQLRLLNSRAEAASERYDAARIKLAAAQTAAAAAQSRLAGAQAKVNALQASITAFAVAAYRGSAATSLLTLTDGSTNAFIGRVSALQAVSASQSETLVQVDAAKRVEEQAQADASAALANQRSATATMSAARNQVLAAAAQEQTILRGLQAKEAAIIKAARAAKARQEAAAARAARVARIRAAQRAEARLRRQQQAAAAAAAAISSQPVSPPPPKPVSGNGPTGSGGAATAVAWANREIGKPYVWGAAGPNSFDCSGLAMFVWAKAGVYLEHFTGDQWHEGTHVSKSQLEPGDLVFFAYNTSDPATIHHVGIYIGGGEMIDAPFTGVDVRKDPAFRPDYIGAVRPG